MKTSTLFPVYGPRSYRFVRRIFWRKIQHFEWSLSHPKDAQEKTLASLLKCLRGTAIEKSMLGGIFEGFKSFEVQYRFSLMMMWHHLSNAFFTMKIECFHVKRYLGLSRTSGTQSTPKIDTDYGELVVFYKTSTLVLGTWFTQRFPQHFSR